LKIKNFTIYISLLICDSLQSNLNNHTRKRVSLCYVGIMKWKRMILTLIIDLFKIWLVKFTLFWYDISTYSFNYFPPNKLTKTFDKISLSNNMILFMKIETEPLLKTFKLNYWNTLVANLICHIQNKSW